MIEKHHLTQLLCNGLHLTALCTSPTFAGEWSFDYDLEGGAEFWTYYTDADGAAPDTPSNEIWITKLPDIEPLGEGGSCSFDNCYITVRINGRKPYAGETVNIKFSDGFELNFNQGQNAEGPLLSNFITASMGATNGFEDALRASSWVDVRFGQDDHHLFDLTGSTAALDAILPFTH